MEKFVDWLAQKFSHPFSLLFFLLGAILVLLGLTTGFEIPILNQLAPAAEYQRISLVLGVACLLIAVLIYYKSPQRIQTSNNPENDPTQDNLPSTLFARKVLLSETQRLILDYVELLKSISGKELESKFGIESEELFYRLEQLRLLGFIERGKIGEASINDTHLQRYFLSKTYEEEINKSIFSARRDITTDEPITARIRRLQRMNKRSKEK